LSYPGDGPQFTKSFAIRQSSLLGGAVKPCFTDDETKKELIELLMHSEIRKKLGNQGILKMGKPGGSLNIANLIDKKLLK